VGRRGWASAFGAVAVVHVAAQAIGTDVAGVGVVLTVTKPLLMPTLAGLAWVRTVPGRTRRWLVAALAASSVGDVALMPTGETWFLVGLAAFLVAQCLHITAMWPWVSRSVLVVRRWRALPYGVAAVALVAVLAPGLGALVWPVSVYAAVIVTMAAVATGVSSTTALGALSFVVSDALIALTGLTALVSLPRPGAWVMATYVAGQALIVLGLTAAASEDASAAAT